MEIGKFFKQAKEPAVLFVLIFSLLLVGFVIFLFCSGWHSDSISPVEIINVSLTSFIAIRLGMYVTKKLTEQRFIKEFVIADVYKIEESLESLRRITLSNKIEVSSIFQDLQMLRGKIEILQKTTDLAEIEGLNIGRLRTLHSEIWTITTDAGGEEKDITLQKHEIQNLYDNFIISLREIICRVNRLS